MLPSLFVAHPSNDDYTIHTFQHHPPLFTFSTHPIILRNPLNDAGTAAAHGCVHNIFTPPTTTNTDLHDLSLITRPPPPVTTTPSHQQLEQQQQSQLQQSSRMSCHGHYWQLILCAAAASIVRLSVSWWLHRWMDCGVCKCGV